MLPQQICSCLSLRPLYQGKPGPEQHVWPQGRGRVAVVFLTEAHVALGVALSHADVVHHEQVDIQGVSARPPDRLRY